MATLPLRLFKNRTNGRFKGWARWETRALAWMAPEWTQAQVTARFVTPQRPRAPFGPEVAGPNARRFTLEDNGFTLTAWEWGSGPTVLLVHGWSGHAGQMGEMVLPLLEAGFQVVAFDLPGHGSSTGTQVTVLDLMEAVLAVARRFRPVHGVVAHSLGATATALALSRGLELERAVLIAPPVEVPHFARRFALNAGLPAAQVSGVLELLRQKVGLLEHLDLRRLAPAMRTPLLLMHDPNDREVPFEHSRGLSSAWPSARLEALRGLGHYRALRDPGAIATAVDFMRGRNGALARRSA